MSGGKGYMNDGEEVFRAGKHWVLGIGMVPISVRGFSLLESTISISAWRSSPSIVIFHFIVDFFL